MELASYRERKEKPVPPPTLYVDFVMNVKGGRCYYGGGNPPHETPGTRAWYTEGGTLAWVCDECARILTTGQARFSGRLLDDRDLGRIVWPAGG